MTKSVFFIVLISLYLAAETSAKAQDIKYEIDYMIVDTSVDKNKFQPNAAQLKYILPYSEDFDFEGILGFGVGQETAHYKYQLATEYTVHFRFTNFAGVYLKAHAKLDPMVLAFAHLGIARMEYNFSSSLPQYKPDGTVSQMGLAYGFGLSLNILEQGAFVLIYDQFPSVKSDNVKIRSSALSIGYQSTF